jgi:hypothetical protein
MFRWGDQAMWCAFSAGYSGIHTKCSAPQAVVWNIRGIGACGRHSDDLMRHRELAK